MFEFSKIEEFTDEEKIKAFEELHEYALENIMEIFKDDWHEDRMSKLEGFLFDRMVEITLGHNKDDKELWNKINSV